MRFLPFALLVGGLFILVGCLTEGGGARAQGETASWHLEEHRVSLEGETAASVIADCRGNNHLYWEVQEDANSGQGGFVQPTTIIVACGMYASRPAVEGFSGWGEEKTNWAQGEGCMEGYRLGGDNAVSYEEHAGKYGEEACSDYFRALRDEIEITAPWCWISFKYEEPVTAQFSIITYCVGSFARSSYGRK